MRPQPAKPHNNKMEEKHILIIAHQTDLKKIYFQKFKTLA